MKFNPNRFKKVGLLLGVVYLCSWLLVFAFFMGINLNRGESWAASFHFFAEVVFNPTFLIFAHIVFVIILVVVLYIRYFKGVYRRKGLKAMLVAFAFYLILPVALLFSTYHIIVYRNSSEQFTYEWNTTIENTTGISLDRYQKDGKHRGMSVFGWSSSNKETIAELLRNNIEWVAITPFFYQKNTTTAQMSTPHTVGIWNRRDSLFIKSISDLHKKGIRVQLKPHLWMNEGWRSGITHESKHAWQVWFESYRKNMLHYAAMAELTKVELFCIGTELKSTLVHMPEAWLNLVEEIKEVYNGELTYAANWDGEYEKVPFWDQMDYIGIQAYFPLTKTPNPDLSMIKKGWDRHISKLTALTQRFHKPVLFTEVGYKSEASATIKPWEWGSVFSVLYLKKSDRTQQLAYEALYQRLWHKDWFAGTYIWQWETRSTPNNVSKNLDFSPRYKPAENTIAKWYATLGLPQTVTLP